MRSSQQRERLMREYIDMENSPIENINASPLNDNLTLWDCIIIGPSETPYADGFFQLELRIPEEYPSKPPIAKFKTKVFHPNIDDNGNICVSILKTDWAITLTISKVLLSICSLFEDPNPGDPLKPDIAELYTSNKPEFIRLATEFTRYYASNDNIQ